MDVLPQDRDPLIGSALSNFTIDDIAIHVFSDFALSASYLLVLFAVVYLNRHKYVSIYLPRRTYMTVFFVVFAVSLGISAATFLVPSVYIHLAFKAILIVMLLLVVAGILAVLPRDENPMERMRLRYENVALKEALRDKKEIETALFQARAEIQTLLAANGREQSAERLRLEKDLIQNKLHEERALEAKRRLEELMIRTSTAVVMLDQQGRVVDCNVALAQLLGRSTTEEISSRDLSRLLGLRDQAPVEHFIRESLRLGSYSGELDASPPDRGIVSVEAHGVATLMEDQTFVMAMMRDVTERRAGEKEVLRSHAALSSALDGSLRENANRSDFLAKMNHELRTPLNGIIGLAEILRHKTTGRAIAGAEARQLASNIHQNGRHLLSVVDDLLDLSRLDAGMRKLSPQQLNLRDEVDAALATLATIAQKGNVALRNNLPDELEWFVDQRAFKQIMINLVTNAVKFSPSGGRVVLDVSSLPEAIAIHVRDQGPGIAREDTARILEPFERAEYAQVNKIDGVGLGLTIVSELLKLHDGRIEIDSTPGHGATFTVIFPLGAEKAAGLSGARA